MHTIREEWLNAAVEELRSIFDSNGFPPARAHPGDLRVPVQPRPCQQPIHR